MKPSNNTTVTSGMLAGGIVILGVEILNTYVLGIPIPGTAAAAADTVLTALFQWLRTHDSGGGDGHKAHAGQETDTR